MSQSWESACKMVPEVFGKLHHNTFRRWANSKKPKKLRGTSSAKNASLKTQDGAGRPRKLDMLSMQALLQGIMDLHSKDALSSLSIVHEWVAKLLWPKRVSKEWTRRLLHGCGLRTRACRPKGMKKVMTPAQIETEKQKMECKIWFLMREFNINPRFVFNIDETTIQLQPTRKKTWRLQLKPGTELPGHSVTGTKQAATATVAWPMCPEEEPFCEVIYKGTSGRCLPKAPYFSSWRAAFSEMQVADIRHLGVFLSEALCPSSSRNTPTHRGEIELAVQLLRSKSRR